jgi:integrase
LTAQEVVRVLATLQGETATAKRDRAIVMLMAYTAIRTIEAQRANVSDLQTQGGRLVLRVQGKGRIEADELVVITHAPLADALYAWLAIRGAVEGALFVSLSDRSQQRRLSTRAIRAIVKRAYTAAGVVGKRKTTHSLRHTAISTAIRNGAPVQNVRALARHANLETTMIYYHELDRLTNPAEAFIRYEETAC